MADFAIHLTWILTFFEKKMWGHLVELKQNRVHWVRPLMIPNRPVRQVSPLHGAVSKPVIFFRLATTGRDSILPALFGVYNHVRETSQSIYISTIVTYWVCLGWHAVWTSFTSFRRSLAMCVGLYWIDAPFWNRMVFCVRCPGRQADAIATSGCASRICRAHCAQCVVSAMADLLSKRADSFQCGSSSSSSRRSRIEQGKGASTSSLAIFSFVIVFLLVGPADWDDVDVVCISSAWLTTNRVPHSPLSFRLWFLFASFPPPPPLLAACSAIDVLSNILHPPHSLLSLRVAPTHPPTHWSIKSFIIRTPVIGACGLFSAKCLCLPIKMWLAVSVLQILPFFGQGRSYACAGHLLIWEFSLLIDIVRLQNCQKETKKVTQYIFRW